MARKKLIRINELPSLKNVYLTPEKVKGNLKQIFGNNNPIILELGCGKGHFVVGMAEKHPNLNFIGIDMKSDRLWVGAKSVELRNLKNVIFIRSLIHKLDDYFMPHSVSEIWCTFPDPHPKSKNSNRRITSKLFLDLYKKLLKPKGILHLKTDFKPLVDFSTEEAIKSKWEIIKQESNIDSEIKTFFEQKHLKAGKQIHYVSFTF